MVVGCRTLIIHAISVHCRSDLWCPLTLPTWTELICFPAYIFLKPCSSASCGMDLFGRGDDIVWYQKHRQKFFNDSQTAQPTKLLARSPTRTGKWPDKIASRTSPQAEGLEAREPTARPNQPAMRHLKEKAWLNKQRATKTFYFLSFSFFYGPQDTWRQTKKCRESKEQFSDLNMS